VDEYWISMDKVGSISAHPINPINPILAAVVECATSNWGHTIQINEVPFDVS